MNAHRPTGTTDDDVLASGRPVRGPRQVRGALAGLVIAAVALVAVVGRPLFSTDDEDRPEVIDQDVDPPVPPTAADEPRPVRVPPLCEIETDFEVAGEPDLDGPPGCPAATPAGTYVSAVFSGNTTVRPVMVTLPDGWTVQSVNIVSGVELRSSDPDIGMTLVSAPSVSDGRFSPEWQPGQLLGRLRRVRYLNVTEGHPVQLMGRDGWQVDVRADRGFPGVSSCRRHVSCLPVLWSEFSGLTGRTGLPVAELAPGGTGRLFVLRSAPVAVWVWNVGRTAVEDQATRRAESDLQVVLASLFLLDGRPIMPYRG